MSLEGVAFKDTNQCQPQWYLQGPDEVGQVILWVYPGEKKIGPTNYFLYGVFDHG